VNIWPEEVLVIRYATLAESDIERLRQLSLISLLLNKPSKLYNKGDLGLEDHDWERLCEWVYQGNGSYFWHKLPEGIYIQRMCEKHIIIGTAQLLIDLQHVFFRIPPARRTTIDDLWHVIRQFVMTTVTLETD